MQHTVAKLLRIGGLMSFAVLIIFAYICFLRSDQAVKLIPLVPKSQLSNHNFVSNVTDQAQGTNSLYNISDQITVTPTQFTGNGIQVEPTVDSIDEQLSHGKMLIYSSYEEQTNGARNMWQLQMWAKTLKMRVVEPFAVNSMFGMIGALPNYTQALRFSDYYDIDKWNKVANFYGGSSLVEWEEFLSNAPHKVIVLYTLLRAARKPIVVTYDKNDLKIYKPHKYEQVSTEDMQWLTENFNIVRVVNFIRDAHKEYPMSLEELNSYVFGEFSPTEVTVVIVNWIGMGTRKWRIQLSKSINSSFLNSVSVDFHLQNNLPPLSPSRRVLEAYENYVSKYIGDHKYIGITFRTHCILRYEMRKASFSVKSQYLLNCSKQLRKLWTRLGTNGKYFWHMT